MCAFCLFLCFMTWALGFPVDACAQLRQEIGLQARTALSRVDLTRSSLNAPKLSTEQLSSGRFLSFRSETSPLAEPDMAGMNRDMRWVPGWRDVRGDVLSVVTAPLRLTRGDALQLAGAGGLVIGVMAGLDRPAARRVPQSAGTHLASVATPASAPGRWYDRMGPGAFALGTVGAFALSGITLQNKQMTRTSFNLVEAMVLTKAITGLFKGVAGRTRPYTESSPWDINTGAFSSQHELKSMPSGHTSRIFALASVIAHDYPEWWVQVPAYTLATSVGVQRVRSGNHWLSDVVVGGALGYLIGRTVARDGRPRKNGGVQYDPIVGGNQLGLRVRF